MEILIISILSYLIGSIPFGFILTKFFLKKDIRNIGSGNIGATNVLRTGNKTIGYTTLLLDIVKAVIPIIYIKLNYTDFIFIASLCIFLGHVFPIWLKFKGGKGVATYLGILFALSFQLSFLFIFTWLVVSLIFRYSSLSSMFGSFTVFVITFIKDTTLKYINENINIEDDFKLILFTFFILIVFTHRKNIYNLKNKTEKKIRI